MFPLVQGSGRAGGKEQAYFYGVAKGSVYEVVSLLTMVTKRGYLPQEDFHQHYETADEIAAMLSGLARAANRR